MQDQVDQMNTKGIKSMMLTNTQALGIQLDNCLYGNFKLLYCSPEKALSTEFKLRIKDLKINRIAVDEAHCISEWGNDFRPAFKQIKNLRNTASRNTYFGSNSNSNSKSLRDIISSLELEETCLFQESFVDRTSASKPFLPKISLELLIKIIIREQ